MSATVTLREITVSADAWSLPGWAALQTRAVADVLFLTPTFQRIWWEELGEGELRVMVGESGGQPLFIAPLCISPVAGLGRTVRAVGGSEVADYLDLIAAPDDLALAWRQVFTRLQAIADRWDTIDLRALPAWSPSRTIAAELAAEFGWSAELSVDNVCPIVRLTDSWERYLAGLRKKDRHELRRKITRLERLAAAEHFGLVGPDDDLPAAIEHFFALHRLSGQDKNDFWNDRMLRFFRRLITATAAEGWLRLGFQTVDPAAATPAAGVLAFRYGDRYYVYNSGYDPTYRDLGAGVVCMGRMIQAAIAEGTSLFDLLQGDESYKYDFGAVNTEVYRCVIHQSPR